MAWNQSNHKYDSLSFKNYFIRKTIRNLKVKESQEIKRIWVQVTCLAIIYLFVGKRFIFNRFFQTFSFRSFKSLKFKVQLLFNSWGSNQHQKCKTIVKKVTKIWGLIENIDNLRFHLWFEWIKLVIKRDISIYSSGFRSRSILKVRDIEG